jgi:hypothetical protein
LIGKEAERGWEQAEDISALLPSLVRYHIRGVVGKQPRQRLWQIPLTLLEREAGLPTHDSARAARAADAPEIGFLNFSVGQERVPKFAEPFILSLP